MTATRVPVDLVPSTASGKSRPSRDRSQSSGRADTRSAAQRARISSATPVIHVHDGYSFRQYGSGEDALG
jgi:hypothetical protein